MMKPHMFRIVFMEPGRKDVVAANEASLLEALTELRQQEYPKSINIFSPNGDILTVALGGRFGFVQHEDAGSPTPRYQMAVETSLLPGRGIYKEVDAGGTPTPIPDYACLPAQRVVEIVLAYARTLRLPSTVGWREV